jgi:hypothetical protein
MACPGALLSLDRYVQLEFAGPAILKLPRQGRENWGQRLAALTRVRGLREGSAQWLQPELWVRVRHLKAKGVLRHATVKQLID